jgi:putative transposase
VPRRKWRQPTEEELAVHYKRHNCSSECVAKTKMDELFGVLTYNITDEVRANGNLIPDEEAEYPWTSYRSNALGETNDLLTPHPLYVSLAATPEDTATRYRRLVEEKLNADIVNDIRYGSAKGLPAGSNKFKADIEKHLRRRLGDGKVGRPFKR